MAERADTRGAGRDCALCPPLRFRLNEAADLPGEAGVLAVDDDFLLMPDLAPLVEGHVLLVTSGHHQCAGAFGDGLWSRAWQWRHRVARVYRAAYGTDDLMMFEHGPGTPQGGGACIDHAHWHLVPVRPGAGSPVRSVRAVLEERGLHGAPATRESVRGFFRAGRSYLLVEERGRATVHPGDGVPSQFLRQAASTARPWRWQETFGLPASRTRFLHTLGDLRAALAAEGAPARQRPDRPDRAASHQNSSPAASLSPNPARSTPSP